MSILILKSKLDHSHELSVVMVVVIHLIVTAFDRFEVMYNWNVPIFLFFFLATYDETGTDSDVIIFEGNHTDL